MVKYKLLLWTGAELIAKTIQNFLRHDEKILLILSVFDRVPFEFMLEYHQKGGVCLVVLDYLEMCMMYVKDDDVNKNQVSVRELSHQRGT